MNRTFYEYSEYLARTHILIIFLKTFQIPVYSTNICDIFIFTEYFSYTQRFTPDYFYWKSQLFCNILWIEGINRYSWDILIHWDFLLCSPYLFVQYSFYILTSKPIDCPDWLFSKLDRGLGVIRKSPERMIKNVFVLKDWRSGRKSE